MLRALLSFLNVSAFDVNRWLIFRSTSFDTTIGKSGWQVSVQGGSMTQKLARGGLFHLTKVRLMGAFGLRTQWLNEHETPTAPPTAAIDRQSLLPGHRSLATTKALENMKRKNVVSNLLAREPTLQQNLHRNLCNNLLRPIPLWPPCWLIRAAAAPKWLCVCACV